MNWIIAISMGGISGWLASIVMRTDAQQGIFLNIIVGCIGSSLGRFLFSSFLGGGHLRGDAFDPMTFRTAFLGAVILPGIVNLVRRGRVPRRPAVSSRPPRAGATRAATAGRGGPCSLPQPPEIAG